MVHRKIRNGEFMHIGVNGWLLDDSNGMVEFEMAFSVKEAKVASLMTEQEPKSWDKDILCDIFNERD